MTKRGAVRRLLAWCADMALAGLLVAASGCEATVSLGHGTEQPTHDGSSLVDAADAGNDHRPGTFDASDASADAPLHDAGYEPCIGKICGASCTLCDPHDLTCTEPPGTKSCNLHNQCSATEPMCP